MDNENASCAHDDEEHVQLSLLCLPVEIFLHICSFLDASTLVHGLSLVCKQFYLILKDDALLHMWKARINQIWPNATHSLLRPARPDKLFWKLSCVAIEKQTALWKQQDSMEKLINVDTTGDKRYSTYVDPVLLMHNGTICIGAGELGTLIYWKLPSREECCDEIGNTGYIHLAYDDYMLDLTAIDNTIYSCSSYGVRTWMLTNTGLVHQRTYDMYGVDADLQCISSCPERALFATGYSDGTICVFDSRSRNKPIRRYRPGTEPVRQLDMNTEYILSAGSGEILFDHNLVTTVSVWDQRAGRIVKSIIIPGEEVYPMCMSIQRDWVFIGDQMAKLHMLNLKSNFELVKSYSTEHTGWITGVRLTHGCLITSSRDGTVRISSLEDPPKPIATLRSKFRTILSMDYLNDTLAISSHSVLPHSGIEVWRPRSRCNVYS
ncbi:F-box/WD repeat-containing protein 9-like [Temnothorax curvispinosus]|uniref:F-box/WD repeat-containing protein 9-like n=1 Tax=Temnothorax curvispinosus TaxID=300111 RepID=A0A6J1QF90_9HYME|nr:F-box/WD repeat-containing protein 9-like [Temnothorax curvispinosus]